MLYVPNLPEFGWTLPSSTARPAAAWGTSTTPAQNSKGSYAQLIAGSSVTYDVWGILININSGATSAANRNILVDIGIDEAGGSSYTVKIPDLLGSCANTYVAAGGSGHWYYFPLFIKSGSSIGARSSVNNATVGTVRVACTLFGLPKYPETTPVGSVVEAIGVTAASSSGIAVTSGTTSEGSWTSLGTPTRDNWYWQLGFGVSDTTMTALLYHADLGIGDGSNKRVVINDTRIITDATEGCSKSLDVGCYAESISTDTIYGRLQCSGTADASLSMIAYGLA